MLARQVAGAEARDREVQEQLVLKDSRLEALEAELEVARSQNAEWHRLVALYDRERATNATQKQQIEALQQQVLLLDPTHGSPSTCRPASLTCLMRRKADTHSALL